MRRHLFGLYSKVVSFDCWNILYGLLLTVLFFCLQIQVLSVSKATKPPNNNNNKKEHTLKQTTPLRGVRICTFVYKHIYYYYCCCLDPVVYKVPEYFSYSKFSYYDLEEEVVNKRLPQPSSAR